MLVFWLLCIILNAYLGYEMWWAWRHQDDWYNQCREAEAWKQYFKEHVAGNWVFFDGEGY